ncbi:hypothetical protein AN958_04740 [Leucoagaricus sp. SymC.cos]|nr:hypothetical protein AN958_04740 [Leucoagaricus sp. SymC.cos]
MTSQIACRGDNGDSQNFESLHQFPPAIVDGSSKSTKRTEGLTPITQTRAAPASTGLENFPGATSNTDSGEAHPTSKLGNGGWTQETHEPRHRSCPTLYPPISPPPEHQYSAWTRPARMIIDIVIRALYYTTIIFTLGQAPRIEVLKKEIPLTAALRNLIADCQWGDPRTSKEHNTLIRRIVAFDTRNTLHEESAYGSMKKRWKEIVSRIRSTWADYATFNLTLALIASWTRFGSRFIEEKVERDRV